MVYDVIIIGAGPAGISASIYDVGDLCKKQVRQITTAVSDGAIAGIQVAAYLGGL